MKKTTSKMNSSIDAFHKNIADASPEYGNVIDDISDTKIQTETQPLENRRPVRESSSEGNAAQSSPRALLNFPLSAGALVAILGVLALIGWTFDLDSLKRVLPGMATMKFNTALCFVLAGTALAFRERNTLRFICVSIIIIMSALSLTEYLTGADLGIDQLFVIDPGDAQTVPGRMAQATGISFILAGISLLLVDARSRVALWTQQSMAFLVGIFSLIALLGYAYDVREFYGLAGFSSMALHTAAAMTLLAGGLIYARADGFMAEFESALPGRQLGRWLLPWIIIFPAFLGWLRVHGSQAGLFEPSFGTGLFVISMMLAFAALAWWTARRLNLTDAARHENEIQLRRLNRTLTALGKSGKALMYATEEDAYLQEICRIIVEDCGHVMVWIGFAEDDEAKTVHPVASSGFETGYLEELCITWADTERGRGPTGIAIRTGQPNGCPNMLTDPLFAPWRNEALRRGYASSIVLPLKAAGKTFGALNLYSKQPYAFSETEVGLLNELADDLAYGITSLRIRAAHARAESALRENEHKVRRKLENLLSPEGDIGNLELSDIIDAPAIQTLMDKFYDLTQIPLAVIDLKGKVLVGAGWQEICTKFHRIHPETCKYCIESDTLLTAGMPGGEYKLYKCKNNMWDVATPIEIGGKTLGHFFTGQFFFDDESPDYELFRAQAKNYGFDEQKYLIALDRVPRLSRKTVDTVMRFFIDLSRMISQLSYSNIKLARISAERARLIDELERSRDELELKVQERTADLAKMNEALRQSNMALEDFAHVASHDLQEPLRKIATFAERLLASKQDPLTDQNRDYMTRMQNAAARMQSLIQDLVKFSRVTSSPDHFKLINLKRPAEEAVMDLTVLLEENEGRVEIDELPDVKANDTLMRQLFQNLIGNAVKYRSNERPVIRIYSNPSSEDGFKEIHVEDNGIGFDEQFLDKIFKPFQRLHGKSSPIQGTGMGLAICRKIIELHGGSITAKSEPGKGSTFIVRLPKSALQEAQG